MGKIRVVSKHGKKLYGQKLSIVSKYMGRQIRCRIIYTVLISFSIWSPLQTQLAHSISGAGASSIQSGNVATRDYRKLATFAVLELNAHDVWSRVDVCAVIWEQTRSAHD